MAGDVSQSDYEERFGYLRNRVGIPHECRKFPPTAEGSVSEERATYALSYVVLMSPYDQQ